MNTTLNRFQPFAIAVLRIVTGYLFLLHGSAKLLGIPHVAMFDGLQPLSMMGFAGGLELVGGAMLILGWMTRPVAFLLAGEMAVAYFTAHASANTVALPLLNGGEAAVLFCFIFLTLVFTGAGALSVDNRAKA
jgi:putative oxidoreductase